ncbi:MAG: elongation factor G [Candidatus Eisenbacteria bacterium]
MREYKSSNIRNVVLVSHGGAGKTSLAECLLFAAKATQRLGRVDEGSSILDYADDEVDRKITINLAVAHLDWRDVRINLIDTPGYADFYGDTKAGIRAADAALVLVKADGGVEVGTEKVWEFADEYSLPRMIVVNRMDKEYADFDKVVDQARSHLRGPVVVAQLPVGKGDAFSGVVDLFSMKYYKYDRSGSGAGMMHEIPAEMVDQAKTMRKKMVESIAECSDELLEAYLEDKEINADVLSQAYRQGFATGKITPVVCASSQFNIGTQQILDSMTHVFPSPVDIGTFKARTPQETEESERKVSSDEPFAALVFKTISEPHVGDMSILRVYRGKVLEGTDVFNVTKDTTERFTQIYTLMGRERREVNRLVAGDIGATVKLRETGTNDTLCAKNSPVIIHPIEFPKPVVRDAIEAKTKGDEDKISSGLARLHQEDRTFSMTVDGETKQTLISGLGELHLDVVLKRLKDRFNVDVILLKPRVAFRETIRNKAESQGKYKKQTGGRGQYGDVWLRVEPLPRSAGFEFANKLVGGSVPTKYVPAVEKGVVESMEAGPLAGYKVVDLKATIFDGSYHDVDSSDMAFKIASSMAFKKSFMDAKPILLEPIMNITVTVPDEHLGDVMGDLSGKRGKIQGIEAKGHLQVIRAKVPLAELYKYSTTLRSMTQGRGGYEREFSHYEEVPHEAAQKVIDEAKAEKEEAKK